MIEDMGINWPSLGQNGRAVFLVVFMGHETYCLYQNSLLITTLYFHCARLHFHAMFNCLAAPIVFPSLLFLYIQPHVPDVFQQFVYMLAFLQSTWYNCSVCLSGWLAGWLAHWLALCPSDISIENGWMGLQGNLLLVSAIQLCCCITVLIKIL